MIVLAEKRIITTKSIDLELADAAAKLAQNLEGRVICDGSECRVSYKRGAGVYDAYIEVLRRKELMCGEVPVPVNAVSVMVRAGNSEEKEEHWRLRYQLYDLGYGWAAETP